MTHLTKHMCGLLASTQNCSPFCLSPFCTFVLIHRVSSHAILISNDALFYGIFYLGPAAFPITAAALGMPAAELAQT